MEIWRDGVETRMFVSAQTGSHQLTMFEQWCVPGAGAPDHLHAVEEVLRVLAGEAEIWVADNHYSVGPGESLVIPAGIHHGFTNTGSDTLHTLAVLASPIFEVHYTESGRDDRRWSPE
jgi:mannose-6-phosphate isomerase-like protein (cupin superfamily)